MADGLAEVLFMLSQARLLALAAGKAVWQILGHVLPEVASASLLIARGSVPGTGDLKRISGWADCMREGC